MGTKKKMKCMDFSGSAQKRYTRDHKKGQHIHKSCDHMSKNIQ